MRDRYRLENNEAAPQEGAAFILDKKTGLRVKVLSFRTQLQLDIYQPGGFSRQVRKLPIVLEVMPNDLEEKVIRRILNRIEHWYYYQQLKTGLVTPPPAGNPTASESAD